MKQSEYEVRLDNEEETRLGSIFLHTLPGIGEKLAISHDDEYKNFTVTDIWHWVGDKKVTQTIVIFVSKYIS